MPMLRQIRDKGLLWPAVMTVVGVAFLIGLGNWQMRRLAWKEGLLAAIAERTHADPVPLATVEARAAEGADPEYTRVKVEGRLLNDHELDFYDFDEKLGPGYHIVTPLKRADGSIVFINRGFVPLELKDPAKRAAGQLGGDVTIIGLVRRPTAAGVFTPDNDRTKNVWYWYDLDAMAAAALGPEKGRIVPLIVDAEAEPAPPGGFPKGGTTRLTLPNRHFEYAMTWYGLACGFAIVFLAFAVTRWHESGSEPPSA
jgi:surfeit locus 1 family protein